MARYGVVDPWVSFMSHLGLVMWGPGNIILFGTITCPADRDAEGSPIWMAKKWKGRDKETIVSGLHAELAEAKKREMNPG